MKKPDDSKIIKALTEISLAITSELYLDDILKLIVTVTAQVLGSKICTLMLLDKKNELVIKASQSISDAYLKKPPLKNGEGIAGKVLREKKPVAIFDIYKNEFYKYKEIAKKEGLCSLLCVPLVVKNKAIGVLDIYTSTHHRFTKKEEHILTAVANQAAIVIENTELLVKTKVIAEELETRKLVERAKGILMKKNNLSEDAAYRLIQKEAMNKRKSMKEITEAILIMSDIDSKN